MSLADDTDFAREVVEQSSKLIAQEVLKVKKELDTVRSMVRAEKEEMGKDLEKMRSEMNDRIESLETEINRRSTQDVQTAFRAGLSAVTPPHTAMSPPVMCFSPLQSSTPSPYLNINPKKRKRPATSQTPMARSETIVDLNAVDEELRMKIAPFFKKDNQASQDYLNDVQRAYIKYKATNINQSGESITMGYIEDLMKEGVEAKLWSSTFSPGPAKEDIDFSKYLLNRLKNERKALRRREVLLGQQDILSSFLDDSMQQKEVV